MASLRDYFPFKVPRPLQITAMEKIEAAFESGRRFIMLEGPSGSGKSALAIAIARKYGPAHILTSQKLLQDQYTKDFPDIFSIRGKGNYYCQEYDMQCGTRKCSPPEARVNGSSVKGASDAGLRDLGTSFDGEGFQGTDNFYTFMTDDKKYDIKTCLYKASNLAARISKITLHNFHSFLYQGVMTPVGGFEKRDLLLIDEAHNIESVIMGVFHIVISSKIIDEPFPVFLGIKDILNYLTVQPIRDKFDRKVREFHMEVESDYSRLSYIKLLQAIAIKTKDYSLSLDLERLIAKIDLFCYYLNNGEDFVFDLNVHKDHETLVIKPVFIRFWSPNLMNMGSRVYMTSATLLNKETQCRNIGLSPSDVEYISLPSEFPVENRPIYFIDCGKMKKDNMPSKKKVLRDCLKWLVDQT